MHMRQGSSARAEKCSKWGLRLVLVIIYFLIPTTVVCEIGLGCSLKYSLVKVKDLDLEAVILNLRI